MSNIDFIVKLRDAAQMLADAANEYLESMIPTERQHLTAVKEETFTILNFEKQQGAKIGEYGVAYKPNNLPDNWIHAHNILRQNNAAINNRYHGENYLHNYWLYGEDRIYRQKLRQV